MVCVGFAMYEIPAWVVATLIVLSTVLFVPHHWQRTKSIAILLSAVPRLVLALMYLVPDLVNLPIQQRAFIIRTTLTAWMLLEVVAFMVHRSWTRQ